MQEISYGAVKNLRYCSEDLYTLMDGCGEFFVFDGTLEYWGLLLLVLIEKCAFYFFYQVKYVFYFLSINIDPS